MAITRALHSTIIAIKLRLGLRVNVDAATTYANAEGEPAVVDWVGGEPCYVVLDVDFRRYVESEAIDRHVLEWLYASMKQKCATSAA